MIKTASTASEETGHNKPHHSFQASAEGATCLERNTIIGNDPTFLQANVWVPHSSANVRPKPHLDRFDYASNAPILLDC